MADKGLEDLIGQLKLLKVQEASILAQIAARSAGTPSGAVAATTGRRVNGIAEGDRIRIKNRVRKPATWISENSEWTEAKERLATVTQVTQGQIHFVTDNGTRTWRAPNNVRLLNNDER